METTPVTAKHYTVDDYLNLPADGPQFQLVAGELVLNPSPNADHQFVVSNFILSLRRHVGRTGGSVLCAPMDVILSREDVFQPDVLFIRPERQTIIRGRIEGAPDLVVEILSPSTRKLDCGVKRSTYAKHGVREYWIVDPEVERVEIYVLEGATLVLKEVVEKGELRSLAVLLGFAMPLADVFAH